MPFAIRSVRPGGHLAKDLESGMITPLCEDGWLHLRSDKDRMPGRLRISVLVFFASAPIRHWSNVTFSPLIRFWQASACSVQKQEAHLSPGSAGCLNRASVRSFAAIDLCVRCSCLMMRRLSLSHLFLWGGEILGSPEELSDSPTEGNPSSWFWNVEANGPGAAVRASNDCDYAPFIRKGA